MKKTFCDLCGKNITEKEHASFDMPFPISSIDVDDLFHVYDVGVSFREIHLDMCSDCLTKVWNGQNDKPFDIHKLFRNGEEE